MMEENLWNIFESTGNVLDYLNYCSTKNCDFSGEQEEAAHIGEKDRKEAKRQNDCAYGGFSCRPLG